MSLIGDYINRGFRGLSNLQQVVEGHYNNILLSIDVLDERKKEIAETRLKICSDCIFNSTNAKKEGIYSSYLHDPHCSICKCPTQVKVLAMDAECPLHEIVIDKNEVPIQYTQNRLFTIVGANKFYLNELRRITKGAETIMIDNEKYIKLNIEQKFKKEEG